MVVHGSREAIGTRALSTELLENSGDALRELKEEVGVDATNVVEHGQLSFHFVDGYKLYCHVFRADACIGTPIETDEANPVWTKLDAIPFDRMWADDATWLPRLLRREHFHGRFVFDGDRMLSADVKP